MSTAATVLCTLLFCIVLYSVYRLGSVGVKVHNLELEIEDGGVGGKYTVGICDSKNARVVTTFFFSFSYSQREISPQYRTLHSKIFHVFRFSGFRIFVGKMTSQTKRQTYF